MLKMNSIPFRRCSCTILSLLAVVTCSFADNAFSDLSSPFPGHGWLVGPGNSPTFQFTSTATGQLSSFDVVIDDFASYGPQAFTLALYADAGNTLGAQLGQWSSQTLGVGILGDTGLEGLVSVAASGVSLTAGTSYWLKATGGGSEVWEQSLSIGNVSDEQLNETTSQPGFTYGPSLLPMAQVNVTPAATPEPASMTALLGGLAMLVRSRARKSRR